MASIRPPFVVDSLSCDVKSVPVQICRSSVEVNRSTVAIYSLFKTVRTTKHSPGFARFHSSLALASVQQHADHNSPFTAAAIAITVVIIKTSRVSLSFSFGSLFFSTVFTFLQSRCRAISTAFCRYRAIHFTTSDKLDFDLSYLSLTASAWPPKPSSLPSSSLQSSSSSALASSRKSSKQESSLIRTEINLSNSAFTVFSSCLQIYRLQIRTLSLSDNRLFT